jgi:hypothetical protein
VTAVAYVAEDGQPGRFDYERVHSWHDLALVVRHYTGSSPQTTDERLPEGEIVVFGSVPGRRVAVCLCEEVTVALFDALEAALTEGRR